MHRLHVTETIAPRGRARAQRAHAVLATVLPYRHRHLHGAAASSAARNLSDCSTYSASSLVVWTAGTSRRFGSTAPVSGEVLLPAASHRVIAAV